MDTKINDFDKPYTSAELDSMLFTDYSKLKYAIKRHIDSVLTPTDRFVMCIPQFL